MKYYLTVFWKAGIVLVLTSLAGGTIVEHRMWSLGAMCLAGVLFGLFLHEWHKPRCPECNRKFYRTIDRYWFCANRECPNRPGPSPVASMHRGNTERRWGRWLNRSLGRI